MLRFLALAAVVGSVAVPSAVAPLKEPYRVIVEPNGSLDCGLPLRPLVGNRIRP